MEILTLGKKGRRVAIEIQKSRHLEKGTQSAMTARTCNKIGTRIMEGNVPRSHELEVCNNTLSEETQTGSTIAGECDDIVTKINNTRKAMKRLGEKKNVKNMEEKK